MLLNIALAFLFGGAVCAAVQILIDKTMLTPARILVSLVCLGVLVYGIGLYEPLFDIFGCGISVPLLGFGATVARGIKEAVDTDGFMGILSGAFSAAAVGCTVSLIMGIILSVFFRGKSKRL